MTGSAVRARVAAAILVLLLCACAGPPQSGTLGQSSGQGTGARSTPKVAVLGLDEDLRNLWNVTTDGGGGGEGQKIMHFLHQPLVVNRADGSAEPRLLAEMASFEAGTWKVFDDGTMETLWKLRPTSWHDGTPFTARDVIFSFQVFRDPDLPNSSQDVVKYMASMEEVDPQTVLVKWSDSYPYADRIELRELLILPAHILESTYRESKQQVVLQPYFSTPDYVGLGPFRITTWVGGSHLEMAANDQYFLGRPKLDRIDVKFIPDSNTLIANLKAGAVQSTFGSKKLDHDLLEELRREWEAKGEGTVMVFPSNYKFAEIQKLPVLAQPADLVDVRVRRALLHAIDRDELARAVWGDRGLAADSWVNPRFTRYQQLKDAITQYPYDPRRAAQLLEEAGWTRGGDGVLQKGGQPFDIKIRDMDGEKQPLIIAAFWKAVGIQGTYEYESPSQLQDRQWRATLTGAVMYRSNPDIRSVVTKLATSNIPTAANRWTGSNRGNYSNPEWDDVGERAVTTLSENTRLELERRLLQIYSTDLPLLPLFYHFEELPVARTLTGIIPFTGDPPNARINHAWNVQEWDLTS